MEGNFCKVEVATIGAVTDPGVFPAFGHTGNRDKVFLFAEEASNLSRLQ
jgi:hypothetical protein